MSTNLPPLSPPPYDHDIADSEVWRRWFDDVQRYVTALCDKVDDLQAQVDANHP